MTGAPSRRRCSTIINRSTWQEKEKDKLQKYLEHPAGEGAGTEVTGAPSSRRSKSRRTAPLPGCCWMIWITPNCLHKPIQFPDTVFFKNPFH